MLNRFEKHFIFYSFSIILVLMVWTCSEAFGSVYADTVPIPPEINLVKETIPSPSALFLQPPIKLQASLTSDLPAPPVQSNIIELEMPKKTVEYEIDSSVIKVESVPIQYEVAVNSLNIRAGASATSKILKVTNEGDLLTILAPAGNGWVAIEGGGYVNSKYIRAVSEGVKPLAKVTILSMKANEEGPLKPSTVIKSDSGLIEAHIKQIFEGTSLADLGLEKDILQIEADYGINAYFTIAVMKLESGNGKSKIAKDKNNLFGLNAIDGDKYNKAFSFKTKGDSVEKFGQIISKSYVNKGYTTVEKVAKKYCNANPKWPVLVKAIMNNDYKKL